MALVTVRLADLVEDFALYPRHQVDGSHVADIARAIEAGHEIPPPVIDQGSSRIVDGFHRCRAYRRVLSDSGEIQVDARSYEDETAILKEAVALNSPHGRRFDQRDRTRSALLLEKHGVSAGEIADLLHTTMARVETLLTRVVMVQPKGRGKPERRPAKPVAYPARDGKPRQLTESQYEVMQSSNGHRTSQTVTQLIRELRAGVTDLQQPGLPAKLWELHDAIAAVVPPPMAEAG